MSSHSKFIIGDVVKVQNPFRQSAVVRYGNQPLESTAMVRGVVRGIEGDYKYSLNFIGPEVGNLRYEYSEMYLTLIARCTLAELCFG